MRSYSRVRRKEKQRNLASPPVMKETHSIANILLSRSIILVCLCVSVCVSVNASGRHPAYVRQAEFFFLFYPVSESQQERGSSHPQTTNSESHPGASCVTTSHKAQMPIQRLGTDLSHHGNKKSFYAELKCKQKRGPRHRPLNWVKLLNFLTNECASVSTRTYHGDKRQ